ncbi:MAG: 2-oxoacid ferredoxin oxidoreductase [Deltaproteobacteria bacterium HGW-Deltaproteobacteria-15]|jgi:2-oxoglutarate ferredoxin oxidoreductase subunit beta|nr:MAG: 2-oxoacid ferredoxin oxidoreductase [Deltaproteobacteria bacterium HGW-Deltaproteobacteria-15]
MSVSPKEYDNDFPIAWCPGCGNFPILKAVKQSLADLGLKPHEVIVVSGIGQSGKLCHYMRGNFFNGLHGRSLPVATGIRVADPTIPVIVIGGDGDTYGEGGNHFIHALRRNLNVTLITHNNQVFGLTLGQASPTTEKGFVTKVQSHGVFLTPFNPLAMAALMQAPFVARGFAGRLPHLTGLIKEAMRVKGFSLVDVLQPCVTFDRVHTFKWYEERVYDIGEEGHDPEDMISAILKAREWGNRVPIGVFYRNKKTTSFEDQLAPLKKGPLKNLKLDPSKAAELVETFL